MDNKTIAAISTPIGMGGIAVIRISGNDAVAIADKVFCGNGRLCDAQSHTIHYGHIREEDNSVVDEVLVSVMRAPRTYTREDVVEISTHGGISASRAVMKCLMKAGAYQAEPGEFTKRAFLNGRIDLSQAEAIIDIINSKTALAHKNALSQAGGSLSGEINDIRNMLVNLCASMQVIIDYPDEELEDVTMEDIYLSCKKARQQTDKLIKSAENGRVIKDGIKTVIAGKPNVGKSSLLNFLAREERAIVTDIAGTTRDVIEETVSIDGVPLILTDTAGIRTTEDIVEKIGVEKSLQSLDEADLVVVVFDCSTMPDDEEVKLLEQTVDKKRIILINKTDIKNDEAILKIRSLVEEETIEFSAKTGIGADILTDRIKKLYKLGEIGANDSNIITNMRHVSALVNASEALGRAMESIENNMPSDIASIDINIAIDSLGEITGAVVSEDIVSAIFHDFCVGK